MVAGTGRISCSTVKLERETAMSNDEKDAKQALQEVLKNQREGLETLRMSFENLVELEIQFAKRLRAKYESLVASGFSSAEAMEIIKARGVNP
jgi:uncharacterized protein (DUF342 family)